MPRILIIEDSDRWQGKYRAGLRRSTVEIVEARTFGDAEKVIKQMIAGATTFDAIVFDGCLNDKDDFDAPPLVQMVKGFGFKGPMIAGSNSNYYNGKLMEAGCTHEARALDRQSSFPLEKEGVLPILRTVLNLNT